MSVCKTDIHLKDIFGILSQFLYGIDTLLKKQPCLLILVTPKAIIYQRQIPVRCLPRSAGRF